jgi:hypothetical protein
MTAGELCGEEIRASQTQSDESITAQIVTIVEWLRRLEGQIVEIRELLERRFGLTFTT